MKRRFFQQLAELERDGRPFVLATVTESGGSTPRDAGARMAITDQALIGTVGGGALEKRVVDEAHRLLANPKESVALVSVHLIRDLAMCCGGKMSVFLEKVDPEPTLWIFGAGHVSTALAPLASQAGFNVTVVDAREEWNDPTRFPDEVTVLDAEPEDHLRTNAPNANDYVVIVTHDHSLDESLIRILAEQPLHFLGMIGSQGKWLRFVSRFNARGMSESSIARVHCPVGLDIGAQTPMEIAVSIVAQLISVR